LRHLSKLSTLFAVNTSIGDEGILELVKGGVDLQEMSLAGTKVTNEGVRALVAMNSLNRLQLENLKVDDYAVKDFWRFPILFFLNLDNTMITDKGVMWLSEAQDLKQLFLDGTQITDASIDIFSRFPALKSLSVGRTKISPAGLLRLKENLPKVSVSG
jgi:hypothetical protein